LSPVDSIGRCANEFFGRDFLFEPYRERGENCDEHQSTGFCGRSGRHGQRLASASYCAGPSAAGIVRVGFNARPSEISYVPSTSAGENLVVNGLGIVGTDANVVTDALHFDGALLHLGELKRRSGLDVRIVMPRDWRIDIKDLERVVDRKTKLIEISLVAMDNGFQHDLKAVCDLAHAHGAYVYADIIQAAGNTPIDVRQSGVDFCACSSFKWLMGDFGLRFLFVREGLLDTVLHRTQYGYYEAKSMESHFLPNDKPGDAPYTWQLGATMPARTSRWVRRRPAWRTPSRSRCHTSVPLELRTFTRSGSRC
jgi:Aminotransferase class-V